MRDQKLKHWLKVDLGHIHFVKICDIKTEKLKEPVATFQNNVWHALRLSTLPFDLVNLGERFALAHLTACVEKFGDPRLYGYMPFTVDECNEIRKLTLDILAKRVNPEARLRSSNLILPQDFIAYTSNETDEAYDTLMNSQLVLCWTAFETLAGDLWRESVNSNPQYLAGLTGTANRIQKCVCSEPKRPQEAKKRIKTDGTTLGDADPCEILSQRGVTLGMICKVTKGSYNLSDKMGTLLIEAGRVQFTSLEAIREAYSLAFSENGRRARTDKIDTTLAAKELDALSAVRNLIVHKAGKADSMYLDDRKSAPSAPKLEENEKLQLDGEVCQSLIMPVLKLSVDLINAVDIWLTTTHG